MTIHQTRKTRLHHTNLHSRGCQSGDSQQKGQTRMSINLLVIHLVKYRMWHPISTNIQLHIAFCICYYSAGTGDQQIPPPILTHTWEWTFFTTWHYWIQYVSLSDNTFNPPEWISHLFCTRDMKEFKQNARSVMWGCVLLNVSKFTTKNTNFVNWEMLVGFEA